MKIRKRIKIAPGLHLNLSNTGISASAGVRGASLNISKRGVTRTLGIPGTGISDTQRVAAFDKDQSPTNSAPTVKRWIWWALGGAILLVFIASPMKTPPKSKPSAPDPRTVTPVIKVPDVKPTPYKKRDKQPGTKTTKQTSN